MICLTSSAVAGDLSVNPRPSGLRMLIFFEHEHPRTLGKDKSVAIGGERPGRALWLIVPRLGESSQHGVAFHDPFRNRRIDATCDKHGLDAGLDMLVRI